MTSAFRSSAGSNEGMSLIMVLMALIALSLAAAALFAVVTPTVDTARQTETQARLDLWKKALIKYKGHFAGGKPATLSILLGTNSSACSVNAAGGLNGFCGPYILDSYNSADLLNDAWGTALNYNSTAGTLTSCGSNLTCGDSDDWKVSF